MTPTETLLPCPFCGREPKLTGSPTNPLAWCKPCGISMPVPRWNARAPHDPKLPCEVTVAPATVFHEGVALSTLIRALERRGMAAAPEPEPDAPAPRRQE